MSFLEKDVCFCKECLLINGLETYNETTIVNKYNYIRDVIIDKNIIIENLCFSGGGIKTIAYIGALQILDSLNLLNGVKRIAASSAGTPIALLIAFKYNITEIHEMLFKNHNHYLDRSLLSVSNIISILRGNYGLHSGNIIVDETKKMINDSFDKHFPEFRKSPDYDPTFNDLYNLFGMELIITGTNISKKRQEYFCPKLTPDMPLYLATRISMSYPFIYEYINYNGSIYIDSICSYPLHIFYDGHDILLPTLDVNIFDKTVGFNNYNIETNDQIIINNTTPQSQIMNMIEENSNIPINGFIDYIFSIIKTAQQFIEKAEMRSIDTHLPGNYFKHTICAILKHIDVFDLNPTDIQRSDAVTLYKIKTLEWLVDRIGLDRMGLDRMGLDWTKSDSTESDSTESDSTKSDSTKSDSTESNQ